MDTMPSAYDTLDETSTETPESPALERRSEPHELQGALRIAVTEGDCGPQGVALPQRVLGWLLSVAELTVGRGEGNDVVVTGILETAVTRLPERGNRVTVAASAARTRLGFWLVDVELHATGGVRSRRLASARFRVGRPVRLGMDP